MDSTPNSSGDNSGQTNADGSADFSKLLTRMGVVYVVFALLVGMMGGLGIFTFKYAEGDSYLSNNPESCVNCHVMQPYYDSWEKSSHAHVAVCNDCHLSHHPVGKWVTKADNGFFHSVAFTLDNYHKPITIKARNRKVTQNGCLYCHKDLVHEMLPPGPEGDMLYCVSCHSNVGHSMNQSRISPSLENPRRP